MSKTEKKAGPAQTAKAAPAAPGPARGTTEDKAAPAQTAKATPAAPAPARPTGLAQKAIQAIVGAYKSFAERAIGAGYATYPALIDDCLDRALVSMRVINGTGTQVLDVTGTDTVLHPSIVGVNTALAGASYQVTVGYNSESDAWTVTASPGISWSVLALYQKAKR